MQRLANSIRNIPAPPAICCCASYSAGLNLRERAACAVQWGSAVQARSAALTHWTNSPQAERSLRIGLVSGDLREHPVGYFLESFLRYLDRSQMRVIAFSNNPQEDDLSAFEK